jgi:hypothetical protein
VSISAAKRRRPFVLTRSEVWKGVLWKWSFWRIPESTGIWNTFLGQGLECFKINFRRTRAQIFTNLPRSWGNTSQGRRVTCIRSRCWGERVIVKLPHFLTPFRNHKVHLKTFTRLIFSFHDEIQLCTVVLRRKSELEGNIDAQLKRDRSKFPSPHSVSANTASTGIAPKFLFIFNAV